MNPVKDSIPPTGEETKKRRQNAERLFSHTSVQVVQDVRPSVRPYDPCDRSTVHTFWPTEFILHLMITLRKDKKPIDFG